MKKYICPFCASKSTATKPKTSRCFDCHKIFFNSKAQFFELKEKEYFIFPKTGKHKKKEIKNIYDFALREAEYFSNSKVMTPPTVWNTEMLLDL